MLCRIPACRYEAQTDKTVASICRRVAEAVQGNEAQVVAYLHDVVEREGVDSRPSTGGGISEILAAVNAKLRRDY